MDECMNEGMDEQMGGRTNTSMDEWVNEQTDGWMKGEVNSEELLDYSSVTFRIIIIKLFVVTGSFINIF